MLSALKTTVAAVRSAAAYVTVFLYILAVAPPGMLLAILSKKPDVLYWLGRLGVRLGLATVGIRYRVEGAEHIQRSRAAVYCVNHTSNLEPPIVYLALTPVHPRLRILYKAELRAIPVLPRAFDVAGFVPIERRNRERSMETIAKAAAALREGHSFLIFPEGTRSRTGELLPFKKGGFIMAIHGGATVVPVAIQGARAAMRKGSRIIRPVTVSVRIGAPIELDGMGIDARDLLIAKTRSAMEALLRKGPIAPASPSNEDSPSQPAGRHSAV